MSSRASRRVAILLLVAAFVAVLGLTLWPTHVDGSIQSGFSKLVERLENRGFVVPFSYGFVEFCLNIALFVPPAALMSYLLNGRHLPWVILTGGAVSVFVEMVQLRLLDGRTSTVQDVLANSLGAAVGAVAVTLWFALRRKPSEGAVKPSSVASSSVTPNPVTPNPIASGLAKSGVAVTRVPKVPNPLASRSR